MIRIVILLCLVLCGPTHGQGQPPSGFDTSLLASVQMEAMDFMLPRTLDVVSAGQLALWGLGGLTAIDPNLSAIVRDKRLQLLVGGRAAIDIPVPGDDAAAWGLAAAQVATAGYAASPAVRQAGQAALTKSLLDEMLAHLDPYSRYLPPIEAVGDRDRRAGHAGVGVALYQHGRYVAVREVVIGSPGAQAGIMPGDVIQRVDGRSAAGLDHTDIDTILNGPEGTQVRLDWADHDGTQLWANLTRVMIPPETVFPRRSGDVQIIQITGFSQTTDQHVAQVVRDSLKAQRPVTGFILDLRGNRGGVLRTAVATANMFLAPGVVVRSAGRAAETNRVWLSEGPDLAKGARMIVLVDGGTASAAEVLAAALADRGRAVVIGSSTFGKGVVQTIDALPDGGELFLTWSRLLAPLGWPIQSLGVMPQVCTSRGDDEAQRQLSALMDGVLEMARAIKAHRDARAPLTPDQIVGIRERCPASDPHKDDVTIAETLVESPNSYDAALLPPMTGQR